MATTSANLPLTADNPWRPLLSLTLLLLHLAHHAQILNRQALATRGERTIFVDELLHHTAFLAALYLKNNVVP